MPTVDGEKKIIYNFCISLTCYQSVLVVAVSDVEARYVVCVLLPI